jgi:hypothetical protein
MAVFSEEFLTCSLVGTTQAILRFVCEKLCQRGSGNRIGGAGRRAPHREGFRDDVHS